MQRILCPTDFTSDSTESVAYALRIARENNSQLTVFHVASFPHFTECVGDELPAYYPCERVMAKFRVDRLLASAEQRVKYLVGTSLATESRHVSWKAKATLGRIAEEIVAAAVEEKADLIVMARDHRFKLNRWWRPSIRETVIRGAPCPVLSIDASRTVSSPAGWRVPIVGELLQNP